MRTNIKRLTTILAFLIITGLWLKELTQRRARESADMFMGPFVTELTVRHEVFIPFIRGLDKTLNGPRWLVYYDSYEYPSCLSPPCISVDLLGRVRACYGLTGFDELLRLSDEERFKQQVLMIEEIRQARAKEEK